MSEQPPVTTTPGSQEHGPDHSAAVEMIGISKRFGAVVANRDVSFTANRGEVHALIGENGAGKSTLMSILAGLYRPDEGTLRVDGVPVDFRAPADAIAAGIGMVYQHFMLVESFTVTENVLLGLPSSGLALDLDATERRLLEVSQSYGLAVDPKALIWQLSVGEQQRVEILRLLMRGATTLVFDEPTAVLTPQESHELIAVLRNLAARGFAVIFISHKLEEVAAVADRVTVLRHGCVVASVDVRDAGLNRRELARMMVGRELAGVLLDQSSNDDTPIGEHVLSLRDLSAMGDKGLIALDRVTFDVRAGEALGIAGVAGNGQRELAEVITGLRRASEGAVILDGVDITNASAAAIARAGVAHVPEDRLGTGLVGSLDLSANAILRGYRDRPISRGPLLVRRAIHDFAGALVRNYEVSPANPRARLRDLSGGNQQKLLIGRELTGEPKAIVAVHPTRGVDVGASEAIRSVLLQQRLRGAAVLLISEDLEELVDLCDRIAVLYEGRIMGIVTPRETTIETIGLMMAGTPLDRVRQEIPA